jgi:hypothetical protein
MCASRSSPPEPGADSPDVTASVDVEAVNVRPRTRWLDRNFRARTARTAFIGNGAGYSTAMALSRQQHDRLPSTLKRSPAKAQDTYIHTLESSEKVHGDGEAAHRIALSALKHSFEKVGDHWEPKTSKGPSDRQAARSGRAARRNQMSTAGGVDANASKAHLIDVARELDVRGRSKMTKDELVHAINRANLNASARARKR